MQSSPRSAVLQWRINHAGRLIQSVSQPLPLDSIVCGDNVEVMRTFPPDSIDAIVTDPPYGLEFMGKDWDHGVPGVHFWAEALRVAKPGAHMLAFGGTRTFHRLAVAIEDAGFEVRDCLMWLYGSGFPKSLDVGKAIDKAAGVEREVVGSYKAFGTARTLTGGNYGGGGNNTEERDRIYQTAPATDAAKQWDGWGTALKPAWEPIIVARKPLEGTVAANVLKHGTGGLNIDGCRVGTEQRPNIVSRPKDGRFAGVFREGSSADGTTPKGRWPANVILDGSDEVVGLFPEARAGWFSGTSQRGMGYAGAESLADRSLASRSTGDSGSAARFFYTAKASASDRGKNNSHPTVKPVDLMRYLVRLVCPIGGIVLDPFNGSGATTYAARAESCKFIGIDISEEYCEIARARLAQGVLF